MPKFTNKITHYVPFAKASFASTLKYLIPHWVFDLNPKRNKISYKEDHLFLEKEDYLWKGKQQDFITKNKKAKQDLPKHVFPLCSKK